ncbi:hypothetical protein NEIELOOT_02595 [Neisseria elongata subsp. glycolytica ATCC 29315]|uniref:Uncharacterized protein n=1 Tax=Neisseria elongata subsp. glycolytica ATCC 29315 TaxID=546263 RepID=D4DU38_NEIEG|nr:hypothetical protein NEIELOOT_02595 [Neisseria elongata subsp. glycolytica ATCC 29315]
MVHGLRLVYNRRRLYRQDGLEVMRVLSAWLAHRCSCTGVPPSLLFR